MDVKLQTKLLRVIQEREFDRVGGNEPVKVNIRILATSNRNLEEEVAKGTFREDLYFRLNVIHLEMPPLRIRTEDIQLLAMHFIKKYAAVNGVTERPLSEGALAKLLNHAWKGNVRELENTMHRAVLIASGSVIDADAVLLTGGKATNGASSGPGVPPVSPPATGGGQGGMIGRTVEAVERDLIIGTLDHCLGNRTNAANILGISIRTLRNKLNQYTSEGMKVPPAPGGENELSAAGY